MLTTIYLRLTTPILPSNQSYVSPPIPGNEHRVLATFLLIAGACLVVDPRKRPTIDGMVAQLYAVADKLGENLEKSPVSKTL